MGVTISLFNYGKSQSVPQKKKIIGIKPLHSINENGTENNNIKTLDQEHIVLQSEIESLRSELTHLKEEKDRMLYEAVNEIKLEKENWATEKANLIEQANDEGYQAGFKEGESEGINQYSEILTKANQIMDATTADYHQTLEKSDGVIIEIAIYIAEKIIKDQISKESNLFENVIKAAIDEIKDQPIISIYVHPNDYEFVLSQKQELRNILDGDAKIAVYADYKMKENSCLIKHPFGQIDASVDTQLGQIRHALEEFLLENEQ